MMGAARLMFPERLETARLVRRMFVETDGRGLHEHYSDVDRMRIPFRRALTVGATFEREMEFAGGLFPIFRHRVGP